MNLILVCPVWKCGAPLPWGERSATCPKGHHFDRAKSGYYNLLQVQERRSKTPGDSKEAVQARRRSLERGLGAALRDTLCQRIEALEVPKGSPVLDAGCGEGYYLSEVCEKMGLDGWGVDISVAAVEAAAKAHPRQHWIVANADRQLPFVPGPFPLILSITARKNPQEFQRLLQPGGRLLVVVAAEDDQKELREAVFGQSLAPDRLGATVEAFAGIFELEDELGVQSKAMVDADGLRDLLKGSYRGERFSTQETIANLTALEVTSSYRVMCFRSADKLLNR